MPYLFVYFRKIGTPCGDHVYFALSRNGIQCNCVNNGEPVLWSTISEKGVRDMTISRLLGGSFVILATDLSLANNFESHYHGSWIDVKKSESHQLALWRSKDLVHWSTEEMITLGGNELGCRRVPETTFKMKQAIIFFAELLQTVEMALIDKKYAIAEPVTFENLLILRFYLRFQVAPVSIQT